MTPLKMNQPSSLYLGLMSGTSLDGLDIALADITDNGIRLIAAEGYDFPETLKQALLHAAQTPDIGLKTILELEQTYTQFCADKCKAFLASQRLSPSAIQAIGNHGQTLYHAPQDKISYQMADHHRLSAEIGCCVVGDFRRMDIALGGQGAPLIPAFHQWLSQHLSSQERIGFLNIGGIANITLFQGEKVIGFDTGPGNMLLDHITRTQLNLPFDPDGQHARAGIVDEATLATYLNDPYFALPFPKSTGREYFSGEKWLADKPIPNSPQDALATLCELTAITAANAITPTLEKLYVFGGGAMNSYLLERLASHLPQTEVCSTEEIDVNPNWMEACAFAWLAFARCHNLNGNLPTVTGASRPALLGAIYQS